MPGVVRPAAIAHQVVSGLLATALVCVAVPDMGEAASAGSSHSTPSGGKATGKRWSPHRATLPASRLTGYPTAKDLAADVRSALAWKCCSHARSPASPVTTRAAS
jgi:hypothetical protein